MLKQFIFTLTLLILASGAFAQRPQEQNPARIDKEVARMDAALDLTADQEKKIKKTLEHSREEMIKDRKANEGNRSAMREAMKARRELTESQIKNILTDAQKRKYDEYLKTRASNAQTAELKETLSLTDEQANKISQILQERNEKMKAVRDEEIEDREARMQKMRSLMEEYNKKITAELNKEQKEKYDEMIKERKSHRRGMGQGGR